jgi:hypothetical protein
MVAAVSAARHGGALATVLAGGAKQKKATTGKSGKVTFKTAVAGSYSAVATKQRYTKATRKFKVK